MLVAEGTLTGVDRWAIGHAMPAAALTGATPTLLGGLVPLLDATWSPAGQAATNVVTLPDAFLLSTALVAVACLRLRNRRAVFVALAFAAANATEEVTKTALTRPALYHHGLHVAGFDNSFPSGHALRTVLVAYAVAIAWPRVRWWVAAWAACSIASIELGGMHVPSDIAGGLLIATAALATTWSLPSRSGPTSPSAASRPAARAS